MFISELFHVFLTDVLAVEYRNSFSLDFSLRASHMTSVGMGPNTHKAASTIAK